MNTLEQAFATIAAANDLTALSLHYFDYGQGPDYSAHAHWADASAKDGQQRVIGYGTSIANALKATLALAHKQRSVIPPALSETDMAALIAEDDRADRREAYWEQVNESLAYQMGPDIGRECAL